MFDTDPCAEDPEIFFSDRNKKLIERARNICLTRCPRLQACFNETMQLEQDLGHVVHGVRAGTTEDERRRVFERIA